MKTVNWTTWLQWH